MKLRLKAVLALLGIAVAINYIDRGNLSIAAPIIKGEMHLSGTQLGFLLTSFFITYMALQIVAGWLCDRFAAGRVLAIGFVVWSAATALTGFAQGFGTLLMFRLLLGVGEAVAFPASSKIICERVPENQRSVANAVNTIGMALGPAFGIFFGGMLVARYGWRPYFIGFGFFSLLWVLAWLPFSGRERNVVQRERESSPPFRAILRQRALWAASLGHFCGNFTTYFMLTWIPFYLVHERHWSLVEMAKIGGAAYLFSASTNLASAWFADRLMAAGASETRVRKSFLVTATLGSSFCLIGCAVLSAKLSIVFLILATGFAGMIGPHLWSTLQTLAGHAATGRWTGVQNMLGNVAGLIAPVLTGFLLDKTGNFVAPFFIVALVGVVGAASWMFFLGAIVPVDWSRRVPPAIGLARVVR